MAVLNVSVVSADQEIWSGEAQMVVAKTVIGEIGILAGHEPVLAILAGGEVRITLPAGDKIVVSAEEGFLSVNQNQVQVVAASAALV